MPVRRRRAMRPSTSTRGGRRPRSGTAVAAGPGASAGRRRCRRRSRRGLMGAVSLGGGGTRPRLAEHPAHAAADVERPTIDAARDPTGSPSAPAARSADRGVRASPRPIRRAASIAVSHSLARSQWTRTAPEPALQQLLHRRHEQRELLPRLVRIPERVPADREAVARRTRPARGASACRTRRRPPPAPATRPARRSAARGGACARRPPAARPPPGARGGSTHRSSAPSSTSPPWSSLARGSDRLPSTLQAGR